MENLLNITSQFVTDTTPIHNWIFYSFMLVQFATLIFLWFVVRKNGRLKTQIWDWEEYYKDSQKEIVKLQTDNYLIKDYKDNYKKLVSATEDRVKIAENRTACAEGELKKFNTKKLAMDYAVEVFSLNDTEENLKETFDVIYDCLKEK